MATRRLILGPESGGELALAAVLVFLAGFILFGMGLACSYLGRLCGRAKGRSGILVRTHLRPRSDPGQSDR
jgi:hypothetical protein